MTKPLWLLAAVMGLVGSIPLGQRPALPQVPQPPDASPVAFALPEDLGRMDPGAQQRWVRETLARLDRANRLGLEPEEAAGQRARDAALAQRAAQGVPMPREELLDLLRQTDEREKVAIERLARQFRVQVYRTFRLRRGHFTRRKAAWNRVHAAWEAAGRQFEQQDRLIDWLEVAIHNSMPQTVGPLPADPTFDPPMNTPEPMVNRRSAEPVGVGREREEEPTPEEPIGSSVPQPLVATPTRPRQLADDRPMLRDVTVGRPPAAAGLPPEMPLAVEPPLPAVEQPPAARPPVAVRSQVGVDHRRPADLAPGLLQQRAVAGDATGRVAPLARPAVPDTRLDKPTVPPLRSDKPGATAGLSSSAGDTDGQANRATLRSGKPTAPSVRVNVDELAAQVAGANLALRALEAELDEPPPWDARRLGPLVDRVDRLVTRHDDIAAVRELISQRERALVGRLESPRLAITQLARRIFEARAHASGPDFRGNERRRQAELEHLDSLSRKLAQLASRQ